MPHQMLIEEVVRDRGSDELFIRAGLGDGRRRGRVMAEREIGAVLVMNEDGLVAGIFTERDLLMRVVHAGRDPKDTPISLVMTRDVRFVSPGTTVEAAMALMHLNRHRHLLVIDGPTRARPGVDARPGLTDRARGEALSSGRARHGGEPCRR